MSQVSTAGAADAAVPQRASYVEIASAGRDATAQEAALAVDLKPFRLPEHLHVSMGKTAPFVPATIATLHPSTADELLRRSNVWVHLCSEEYADATAAYINERFSLRFAALRATKITFFRAPGVKPFFLMEKMGEKQHAPLMQKTMTVLKLAEEEVEDGPEVVRFTGPETLYASMHSALAGIPHRKLSHPKDTVRAYEVLVESVAMKSKLAEIGLVEERRAVVSSRFQSTQVTVRPRQKTTAEQLFEIAKQFKTASGAMLRQGALRLRFESPEALKEATAGIDRQHYLVIFDEAKKKEEPATWCKGMSLPEPKAVWAIKSLNSRSPEVFEEAAKLLGVRIFKLPTFTLALVEPTDGAPSSLTPTKLSALHVKFRGMTLDLLDRF